LQIYQRPATFSSNWTNPPTDLIPQTPRSQPDAPGQGGDMSTDGPNLLTPLELRGVRLPNRIMMSPMSQHRADVDGRANDWHLVHYGSRAVGGVGIIMVEDCAVRSDGRLSNGALGLYADSQVEPLRRV